MNKKIGIVQINDTHANLLPTEDALYGPDGFEIVKLGGYSRIMTKIKEFREKHNDNLLVFDNGDTFHGRYEAVESKGEIMLPYLNKLGIDAMTFHWDIAYTPKHLQFLESKLNYPILANNVYHEGTKDLLFKPYEIYNIDDLKIGVIGIASNIIRANMPKPFWIDTEFTNGIDETRIYVEELKEKNVDLILLLSHLGYPQDIELIKEVPGIDIVLSGHTHNRIRELVKIENTYIIQSGSLATSIGYLEIELENNKLENIKHEFIRLDDTVDEDPEFKEMIENDKFINEHKEYPNEIVGETLIDLHRASSFYGTMDYLLLDSMREATGLDIAFSNGWRYGGAISKGKLTRSHLYQIVPMDPEIMTAELTGNEIYKLLEDNLESTFSCEPFKQMGGYIKRNSGIKVYFKLENPYGQRIQKVYIGNEELDLDKLYKVAYVTRQGVPETFGKNHKGTDIKSVQAMEMYLSDKKFDRTDLESYIPV